MAGRGDLGGGGANDGGTHHSDTGVKQGSGFPRESNIAVCAPSSRQSPVLLQIARVQVLGPNGLVHANVLFDTGSDRTYISQRLVNKVRPEWVTSESVAY